MSLLTGGLSIFLNSFKNKSCILKSSANFFEYYIKEIFIIRTEFVIVEVRLQAKLGLDTSKNH